MGVCLMQVVLRIGMFILVCGFTQAWAQEVPETSEDAVFEEVPIDDAPRLRHVSYPDWFKLSFMDFRADLEEAVSLGKFGLVVYFGQEHCPYCEALMEVNLKREDIARLMREHFDVIPIDIWGSRELIDMQGKHWLESDFAVAQKTNFTPSLVFYDHNGKEIFRIRGYYPPYRFRAALEYIVHRYYRGESFADYLARADPSPKFEATDLNDQPFFSSPPFFLERSRIRADRPLVVFFEQGDCHACDVLHTEPLSDETTRSMLESFEVVQLDMWSDTPLITPRGKRLRAREWARELGISYTPTLVFFDEGGEEIIRVDALVRHYRLRGVVEYVYAKGYLQAPTFQRWRQMQRAPQGLVPVH